MRAVVSLCLPLMFYWSRFGSGVQGGGANFRGEARPADGVAGKPTYKNR